VSTREKGIKYQGNGRLSESNKFAEKLADSDDSKLYDTEEYSDSSDFCNQDDMFLPNSGGKDGECLCN
jgi:hypothetical protein